MRLLVTLGLVALAGVKASDPVDQSSVDYEALLGNLWTQTDEDADDKLSLSELTSAFEKLDIDEEDLTENQGSLSNLFVALDGDADGGLSQAELAAAISDYAGYQDLFVGAFSNGAGKVPEALVSLPSDEVKAATATLTQTLILAGTPGEPPPPHTHTHTAPIQASTRLARPVLPSPYPRLQ
jgi:hypothetical protein